MNLRGTCSILFCLDLAREIDLTKAQDRLTAWHRATFHHKSRVLTGDAALPPLRLSIDVVPPALGTWSMAPQVEFAIYEQGALCVTWRLPFDGPLDELVDLSVDLYDHAELRDHSRRLGVDLLASLDSAADRPLVSDVIEDYVVFEISDPEVDLEHPGEKLRGDLARILRAERDTLSTQEVEDALSDRVSYRKGEVCFVDWLGALLVGRSTEDERLVLELATVELLELRLLDAQLDQEIDEAYRMMERRPNPWTALTVQGRELHRIGRMQADGAVLHERVDNALKLLGDDYLARLYRTAADRFHFNDWDVSIERKLGFLRNTYESLAGLASHRRSELLEWIIIVLIAVEIVLYFFPLR
ncbi:hypothetical protein [Engelhardtia mirabilis]|uniref:DUF155 domain-containing protein n=1 Tax=Engelhardtia mirabilis TaxID=2528011 RepID=A0A518BME1_9BACT|nr:hypothetical protein Pla133_32460 [Planctomycetes bacterium Pla133]QDV02478.1 hypothetical protein Pla86_32450 [Planctomycetes bacterium Pla86]